MCWEIYGDPVGALQSPSPRVGIEERELTEMLDKALRQLSPREQVVLGARFGFQGRIKTLKEVGKIIGVTGSRVGTIQDKALRKLRHESRTVLFVGYFEGLERRREERIDARNKEAMRHYRLHQRMINGGYGDEEFPSIEDESNPPDWVKEYDERERKKKAATAAEKKARREAVLKTQESFTKFRESFEEEQKKGKPAKAPTKITYRIGSIYNGYRVEFSDGTWTYLGHDWEKISMWCGFFKLSLPDLQQGVRRNSNNRKEEKMSETKPPESKPTKPVSGGNYVVSLTWPCDGIDNQKPYKWSDLRERVIVAEQLGCECKITHHKGSLSLILITPERKR